jgi:hypothetical protein
MSRPSTSLGFNLDADNHVQLQDGDFGDDMALKMDEDEDEASHSTSFNFNIMESSGTKAKSDGLVKATPLRRANTVGPTSSLSAIRTEGRQSTLMQAPIAKPPKLGMASGNGVLRTPITLNNGIVSGKPRGGYVFGNNKAGTARGMFGVAPLPPSMQPGMASLGRGRVVHRASKQTSLPVVQGSPVKGDNMDEDIRMDQPVVDEDGAIGRSTEDLNCFVPGRSTPSRATPVEMTVPMREVDGGAFANSNDNLKVQEKKIPSSGWKNQSRRASQAHQFLSESLSSLPHTPPRNKTSVADGKGKGRVTDTDFSTEFRSTPGGVSGIGPRVFTRRAASVVATDVPSSISPNTKAKDASRTLNGSSSKPKTLKILRHCNVFVDVRTDDGDDAGSLFVEMLRGLGARVSV